MISAQLESILRCPQCHGPLAARSQTASAARDASAAAEAASASASAPAAPAQPASHDSGWLLVCTRCGETYAQQSRDFVDLRPATAFAEQTKYLDEALHADARHESVSPPLLQAGIRQRQLRRFLKLQPTDTVIDLGCGSGRSLLWNAASGARFVGADVSPFFAREARARVDLALADLRKLPFDEATFTKGYALDVLEHLSPEALDAMLTEAARVLKPGGALFVYSHVRKNAPIAAGLRWINALARWLERRGLIDMTQERLRKSDHLNPLTDIPHLERVVSAAGFRIERIRYYTPLVGGFVENILMRMAERAMSRRAAKRMSTAATTVNAATAAPPDDTAAVREARTSAKARIARRGPLSWALHAVTAVMEIDMLLFGRIRSGPFFALLVKDTALRRPDALAASPQRALNSSPRPAQRGEGQG